MRYFLGVLAGLLAGIVYNSASLIQKSAVSKADHGKPLVRQLIRSPLWILSVLATGIFVFVFVIFGQMMIGPTLIPGLTALGMIIIPIGATKFIGEKNGVREYLGIISIIIGVFLLSLSRLSIDTEKVAWLDPAFFHKCLWYYGSLSLLSLLLIGTGFILKRYSRSPALFFSLSGGLLLGLSNILAAPIAHQITLLAQSQFDQLSWPYLVIGIAYLLLINVVAVYIMQRAFKHGQVSVLIPIQQLPVQVIPIVSHFWLFTATFPTALSRFAVPAAVLLIMAGAVALGKSEAAVQ